MWPRRGKSSLLRLLPHDPTPDKRQKMDEWMFFSNNNLCSPQVLRHGVLEPWRHWPVASENDILSANKISANTNVELMHQCIPSLKFCFLEKWNLLLFQWQAESFLLVMTHFLMNSSSSCFSLASIHFSLSSRSFILKQKKHSRN